MKTTALAAKCVLCGVLAGGLATATACSSDPVTSASDARTVGSVTIPLLATVGTNTYRLEAEFSITGEQGTTVFSTNGDEPVLTATLPAGDYDVLLGAFTLFKKDSAGAFVPVAATVREDRQYFTILPHSTTSIAFQFDTDGAVVSVGSGDVDITFGVSECNPISVDSGARAVQAGRFFLDFSNFVAGNPEALDVLQWAGGPNLARSFAHDTCTSGVVEHFGNSWVPPDPQSGGGVLVGSGTAGSWEQNGSSIVIRSMSSGCAQSVSVPVETRYRFRKGIAADTIEVNREFDLRGATLSRPFRPFIPRLTVTFDRVLHPDATGTALVEENVFACPYGCELSDWDGSWFAYYQSSGPSAGQAMIVRRPASAPPAHLWIDNDAGITDSNASGVLFSPPEGGFPSKISEKELLCFVDADTWTSADQAALTLPPGCELDLACNPGGGPCDPNPCQHGGTCNEAPSGYACTCPPGINGKDCEIVFTQIESGADASCGLRSDGRMVCWNAGHAYDRWDPADTFETLSMSENSLAAMHTGGPAEFWQIDGRPVAQPTGLPFVSLSVGQSWGCGILADETISCFGYYDAYFDPPPSGTFEAVAVGHWHACALRPDHTVTCWPAHDLAAVPSLDFGQAIAPSGTFSRISAGTHGTCGLRDDGTITCWGAQAGGAPLLPPPGTFIALDYDSDFGCGIRTDQTLACWGTAVWDTPTSPPPGTYRALATGDAHPCAIATDDHVVCWGGPPNSTPQPPPTSQP